MELFRLHAYAVAPRRTDSDSPAPSGGAVTISAALRSILEESVAAARFQLRTQVDFEMPGSGRSNEVRDHIMAFAFRDGGAVKSAALGLATRLADAMDMRSGSCLLILAGMREGNRRRVTLWAFPRDQAFRLRSRDNGATIQILTDVFSQTSKLRKAAMFEGRDLRNEFLQGRALDFQANQLSHEVADFWINRFLQCALSLRDDAGTRMLAMTVRKAVDACDTVSEKEQILTAVMAIRTSPQRRWSINSFADTYLSGEARDRFLAAAPNAESRPSMFNFRREEFEAFLAFRVYALESGVLVSSPLREIGHSVQVTGTDDRQLSCEGRIVDEKVRLRHA
jgi:hypothetical protein